MMEIPLDPLAAQDNTRGLQTVWGQRADAIFYILFPFSC